MTDPAGSTPLEVTLSNPKADRVKRVRVLAGASARTREGRFLAEGPQAVREAVRFAADRIQDLYLTPEAVDRNPEILAEAWEAGLYVRGATAGVVAAMSGDAQGAIAVVDMVRPSLEEAVRAGALLVAILSNIRDPGNLGTIIRIADAAGADAVVLSGDCVDPFSPKVVRASTGSLFHLPVVTEVSLRDATVRAKEVGFDVFAAAGSGSEDIFALADEEGAPLAGPIAWVFGNEAWGLSEDEEALADRTVRLPILGRAESLNVAAAVSVALYFCAHSRLRSAGKSA